MTTCVEGKTRRPEARENGLLEIFCKDDVTAYNGKRHEVLKGKGKLVASTIVQTGTLFTACGLPVAVLGAGSSENSYLALGLDMIPVEAVARRLSSGSMTIRHPYYPEGLRFSDPVVELYLKTKNRKWTTPQGKTYALPCDDPIMLLDDQKTHVALFHPKAVQPKGDWVGPFLELSYEEVFTFPHTLLDDVTELTLVGFLILEKAIALAAAGVLVDYKIEFGLLDGNLYIAEPPSFEEWRLLVDEEHLDKEPFRNGESTDKTLQRFTVAANMAQKWLPAVAQRVVAWNELYQRAE